MFEWRMASTGVYHDVRLPHYAFLAHLWPVSLASSDICWTFRRRRTAVFIKLVSMDQSIIRHVGSPFYRLR
jgi:hypothetical protein